MNAIIKSKYKNLNFNLKIIIFDHLPLIQILNQVTSIDKSTLISLKKNPAINFIKKNYYQFEETILGFNCESIDKIKNMITSDSNLKENNIIDEIIVYLISKYLLLINGLYLSWNNLGENILNMMYLTEGLKMNTSIETLVFWNCKLGDNEKNMIYLSECLKINKSIKILNLGSNNLGVNEQNIIYLSEALKINNSIRKLDLSSNNLGVNEQNMMYISKGLKMNLSIKELLLTNNNLGENEKSIVYLSEGIKCNTSIETLVLSSNNLGENIKQDFFQEANIINIYL